MERLKGGNSIEFLFFRFTIQFLLEFGRGFVIEEYLGFKGCLWVSWFGLPKFIIVISFQEELGRNLSVKP